MKSRTTKRFRKAFDQLPDQVQRQAREAYKRFIKDPYHTSLRFKQVHSIKPIYSARINIDYRAVGILKGNEIIWFWIGSHADYDKILSRL